MRALSEAFIAAQKGLSLDNIAKVVLTGAASATYTKTRILSINHVEDIHGSHAFITLDNSDLFLTTNYRGYKCDIYYGLKIGVVDTYSQCAPLWINDSAYYSAQNKLYYTLYASGLLNMLDKEYAGYLYQGPSTSIEHIKEVITKILDNRTDAGSPFNQCPQQTVAFDTEDGLIDTYIPRDWVIIYGGETRLKVVRKLLALCGSYMRVGNDSQIHILVPTTTGTTYAQHWALSGNYQTFWFKRLNNSVVIPNYIHVYYWDVDNTLKDNGTVKSPGAVIDDTTMSIEGLSPTAGTILKGTMFEVEGDSTVYTITANTAATGGVAALTFTPGLKAVASTGEKVTLSSPPKPYYGYHSEEISYGLLPKDHYYALPVEDTAQCTAIATAIQHKFEYFNPLGALQAPQHAGIELHDYVKIEDTRENTSIVGNIGFIRRTYTPRYSKIYVEIGNKRWAGV